jgi:PHD/YefM family antitoxin component YafN of YafNO toxin-antitoxin module
MKFVSLQETPTHYLIKIDQATIKQGPILLQREGQAVAVLLSVEDYNAFRAWQAAQQPPRSISANFEAEIAAFEQLKPALLERYPGRAVAIYQGQVVEVGDDKMEVLAQVIDKLGDVSCYIEWVEPDAPRRVRVPSVRVANK